MKYLGIFFCVIWLALHYRTFHIYKSRIWKGKEDNSFGWLLGSVIAMVSDGFAWYWLYKLIGL